MDVEFLDSDFDIDDSDDSKQCLYIDTSPTDGTIRTNADCSEPRAHICAVLSVLDAEPEE